MSADMTTNYLSTTNPRVSAGPAVAAGATALALTLVGSYLVTPWRSYGEGTWALDERTSPATALLLVGFVAAGVAVVFGVVVRRGLALTPDRTAARALLVAGVSVASILVVWTGLPVILAAGAAVLALDARRRLRRTTPVIGVALIIAGLVTLSAVVLAFAG